MRLIDADALINATVKNPLHAPYITAVDVEQAPTICGWISVKDRLPENAKHPGAFCPRYYVQTEFGMTEGWYNPDRGKWYVLLWFIHAQPGLYLPRFVDLEHGDIPLVSDQVKVSHWMPLPEPPEEVTT